MQTVRAELCGTDENIKRRLAAVKEQGESVQGYIKTLIRADIQALRPVK